MKQRFTSRQTSINSRKAPAVYSMPKAAQADRQPPTVGKKTGEPLIIWTKSPPLSRVGTLPGLVV